MKIPLKYGLLTTIGVAAWVLTVHALIDNPKSIVHSLGTPIFFNVFQFAVIYLGLKALEREKGERPTFKQGLTTGVGISFVYAFTIWLFFVGVIAVVGTKWLAVEPNAGAAPNSTVMAKAFAGLIIGSLLFGLIYSTLISFFIAKRRSDAA